jgi:hypothetical protein
MASTHSWASGSASEIVHTSLNRCAAHQGWIAGRCAQPE